MEQGFHEKIQNELSAYTEKHVNKDGSISKKVVNNPYFLMKDVWNLEFFCKIENFKVDYENYKSSNNKIHFSITSPPVNLEIKYIFYNKLFNDEWSLRSLFLNKSHYLKRLTEFINEKYPILPSLFNLELEEAEKEWINWLSKLGITTTKFIQSKGEGKKYHANTSIANFLRHIHGYLFKLTDTREEWDKDRWDVRELNKKYGIRYNKTQTNYYIDFSTIGNVNIRKNVKNYIKQRLLGKHNFSWAHARNYLGRIPNFINFILSIEPYWNDLRGLERHHIEKYLEWIHHYTKDNLTNKNSHPEDYISKTLKWIRKFLVDLQTYEYSIAPKKHVRMLIYPEDLPRLKKKAYNHIDYIPDYVLEQLFENIKYLHPDVQPIIWIAFKTGLRISEVLGLRQDSLVKLNNKYQIVTDIEKTYVKGHSIPIDDKLANMIAVIINKSVQKSNEDNNPEKYIFLRYHGIRKGRPFSQGWVREQLNILAKEKNITDENGQVFHFKTHQFRHTYAVKLINGGADILTVQELLAHASPEMTMRYARLLDNTKRKAFEDAVKQGVFCFDLNGEINKVGETKEIPQDVLEMLWRDQKLTSIDNPYGSCRARLNGNCPYAEEPPCLTCNGGKPCKDLAVGLSEMDLAKYEIHIQSTSKMIEAAKQYGREEIVDKNQKNLERLQDIYNTIKDGNIIFGRLDRVKRK